MGKSYTFLEEGQNKIFTLCRVRQCYSLSADRELEVERVNDSSQASQAVCDRGGGET